MTVTSINIPFGVPYLNANLKNKINISFVFLLFNIARLRHGVRGNLINVCLIIKESNVVINTVDVFTLIIARNYSAKNFSILHLESRKKIFIFSINSRY